MKTNPLPLSTLFLFVWVVVTALSCGGDAVQSTDQVNIQGVWLAQTESLNGIVKDVIYQYVFNEDTLTFTDETGAEVKYSFKLDTMSNPRLIVIQSADVGADTTSVAVAYELQGDSLKIVVAPPNKRPLDISDKNDQELIICKRKGV